MPKGYEGRGGRGRRGEGRRGGEDRGEEEERDERRGEEEERDERGGRGRRREGEITECNNDARQRVSGGQATKTLLAISRCKITLPEIPIAFRHYVLYVLCFFIFFLSLFSLLLDMSATRS